jgi:hypothetical protein
MRGSSPRMTTGHPLPQPPPGHWREQKRQDQQGSARYPPDALPRPGADLAHHELLALAHFGVRFQEG